MFSGSRRPVSALSFVALALISAGCGGSSTGSSRANAPPAGASGGQSGTSPVGSAAGSMAAGNATGAAGTTAEGGGPDVLAPADKVSPAGAPPGAYVTNEAATGSVAGPCATTTLGAVLAAIRATDPTLGDIHTIYDPATATTDGSFIYAYDVGAQGFDIVFKRGLGDCSAGCTENDYQYFTTNASCQPVKVGHYDAAWGTGPCLTVDGTPLWTHPSPPDPLTVCGADTTPRDLRGSYDVGAAGQRTACAASATPAPLTRTLKLLIEQSATDLGAGFVTFSSTGDPLIDGVRLPARFQRSRFDAELPTSTTADACPSAASITARYDFEGYEPGSLDALEVGGDVCGACKGSLSLDLGDATPTP